MLASERVMAWVDGSKWGMRRAAGVASWLLLAPAAGADPARLSSTFPPALDEATVRDWLRQETGASADQIVAISASAATRILSVETTGPGRRRVIVEAQALSAEAAARSGVLAWRMPLEADCPSGRVRLGPTVGYASRRALGAGVPLREADPDWRVPPPGTQLDSLRKAACAHGAPTTRAKAEPSTAPAAPDGRGKHAETPHASTRTPTATPAALAVQVISSPDRAEAQRAIQRLHAGRGESMAGLQTRVAPAEVRGRTTYRGLVTGFASREAAVAFCRELAGARQACFLRQPPPEARPLKPVATR
jgi:hypothetical protein